MRDDAMEFGDSLSSVLASIQQEFKVVERVAAHNASDMGKIDRMYECDEERRKWKAYHRYVRKYRASISKVASSKYTSPC